MANFYPNGLGGTVDIVATNQPFYGLDSEALYVHFADGVDTAGTGGGRDKQRPLKTLAKAYGNASANDVIVLLDGHDEVLTATLSIAKEGLIIVGCGQTAGVPNVRLRLDLAVGSLFNVNAVGVQLRNILFDENVQLNAGPRILVNSDGFVMDGCYVKLAELDYAGLDLGADYATIRDCTFISTALTAGTQPYAAITSNNPLVGLTLDGLVLSDGALGFFNRYAIDLLGGPATNLCCDRLSLLLGASARFLGATGHIIPTVTGGGVIDV